MFFNQLFTVFNLVKIIFLFVELFYIIFLFIVFNQIVSMENIISEIHSAKMLKLIVFVNVALAASLFLATLVIL